MMTKTVIASVLTVMLASFVGVAAADVDQGHGVVNFKGSVIDAPCGIAPESADQTIDFGQISKVQLQQAGGTSAKKSVDIKLVQCDTSTLTKGVSVTFSGLVSGENTNELMTSGKTNTAIVMTGYGSDVTYGTAHGPLKIGNGDQTLHFTAAVKAAAGKTVSEGDFTATANFNMSYE